MRSTSGEACVPPHRSDSASADRHVLCQHDVRDLIARGHTVEDVASWVRGECKDTKVTPRVNVLEIRAPDETQLRVERLLETKRRSGPYVLRVHPVADLVAELRDFVPPQVIHGSEEAGAPLVKSDVDNEEEPYRIDALIEVVGDSVKGVATVSARGRNLVVLAEPAAQIEISLLLDDLRATETCDGPAR